MFFNISIIIWSPPSFSVISCILFHIISIHAKLFLIVMPHVMLFASMLHLTLIAVLGMLHYHLYKSSCCCSVAMSDSSWPQGLQHARLCSLIISLSLPKLMSIASVMPSKHLILRSPLLLLLSIFLIIRVFFPMSWLFASGGQSIRTSASALVFMLPMSIQCWFPLRLTCLISLLSKGPSRFFSSTTVRKHQFFGALPSLWSSSHNRT